MKLPDHIYKKNVEKFVNAFFLLLRMTPSPTLEFQSLMVSVPEIVKYSSNNFLSFSPNWPILPMTKININHAEYKVLSPIEGCSLQLHRWSPSGPTMRSLLAQPKCWKSVWEILQKSIWIILWKLVWIFFLQQSVWTILRKSVWHFLWISILKILRKSV